MSRLVSLEGDRSVAVLRLDRPKVNALSLALLDELTAAVAALRDDPPGALVITGGPANFSAGADLDELAERASLPLLLDAFDRAFRTVASFPRATVAAIAGVCLGGGLELALACDFRIAARAARIAAPEVLLGLIPGAGGTQRLTRVIGVARTKDLVLSGRTLSGEEASAFGLVTAAVDAKAVLDEAFDYAQGLASGPVAAQSLAKQAIDGGLDLTLEEGLALERRLFCEAIASEEAGGRIAAFLARRHPAGREAG